MNCKFCGCYYKHTVYNQTEFCEDCADGLELTTPKDIEFVPLEELDQCYNTGRTKPVFYD